MTLIKSDAGKIVFQPVANSEQATKDLHNSIIMEALKKHLSLMLAQVERKFCSDEWFDNMEEPAEYIEAAEFCYVHFGRSWNHNIKKWYDNHLPGVDRKEVLPERF